MGGARWSTRGADFDDYVAEGLEAKYTDEMPLLTRAREEAIRQVFDKLGDARGMPAHRAYEELFTLQERSEYPLADFLDDLDGFQPLVQGDAQRGERILSCSAFLEFLRASQ